eukprot:11065222-Lingulodinium_polyedra.AAC.1
MCIRDRNDVSRPQRFANRTFAHSMRVPVFGPRVERAVCEPLRLRNVHSTASLRGVFETLRVDAFESTLRGRSGLQTARLRI